jgi:hypothetical protein
MRITGAGESGKSTILKQMRLIHSTGFKTNERKGFRNVIFQNVIEAFLMMFDIMDAQRTAFEDQQNQVSWACITRHLLELHFLTVLWFSDMLHSWNKRENLDLKKAYRWNIFHALEIYGQIWGFNWQFWKEMSMLCTTT